MPFGAQSVESARHTQTARSERAIIVADIKTYPAILARNRTAAIALIFMTKQRHPQQTAHKPTNSRLIGFQIVFTFKPYVRWCGLSKHDPANRLANGEGLRQKCFSTAGH
jgi:hypothetical protein